MRVALGLLAFWAMFTAAGYAIIVAVAGFPSRRVAASLAGLAYLTGLAGLGSLLVLEAVLGVPFGLPAILATAAALVAAGLAVARRRGGRLELPARAHPWWSVVGGAALAAAVLLVLESGFRAARLHGLFAFDAGAFWVPKAQALFFTGGLDEVHFATLPGPSYPPLAPVLQASAFAFMGAADVVALHLVVWSVSAALALGAGLLLARLVDPLLAWAAVLALVTATEVVDASRVPQADLLLDVFLGFALLLSVLWLVERRPAWLGLALVFVAGAALTKREGLVSLACLAAALLVARQGGWRARLRAPALVAAAALLAALPWRIWFTSRSLPGDAPEAGGLGLLDNLDRALPSLWLVLETLAWPEHWSILLPVAVAAVAGGYACGRREAAVLVGAFLVLSAAAFVWVIWAFPALPITQVAALNPVVRLAGAALIPVGLCVPVLLGPALDRFRERRPRPLSPPAGARTLAAVALVAAAFPLAVLALDGPPRFPGRDDCAEVLSRPEEPFVLVYDRRASLRAARAVHERLLANGFVGAVVQPDGCGRWEVLNPDVETLEQAAGHAEDARRAGFSPRLERP